MHVLYSWYLECAVRYCMPLFVAVDAAQWCHTSYVSVGVVLPAWAVAVVIIALIHYQNLVRGPERALG